MVIKTGKDHKKADAKSASTPWSAVTVAVLILLVVAAGLVVWKVSAPTESVVATRTPAPVPVPVTEPVLDEAAPAVEPPVDPSMDPSGTTAGDLPQRVTAVETDMVELMKLVADLSDIVTGLEAKVAALESSPAAASPFDASSLAAQKAGILEQLMNLQQAADTQDTTAAAGVSNELLAAYALTLQLQHNVVVGRPLATLAKELEQVAMTIPGLPPLLKTAVNGLWVTPTWTVPVLQARLQSMEDDILAMAEETEPVPDGWWPRLRHGLRDIIYIRRVDGAEAEASVEGLLTTAQSELATGQVEEAAKILMRLPEAERNIVMPWLREARRRAAALATIEQVLEFLNAQAVQQVTGQSGGAENIPAGDVPVSAVPSTPYPAAVQPMPPMFAAPKPPALTPRSIPRPAPAPQASSEDEESVRALLQSLMQAAPSQAGAAQSDSDYISTAPEEMLQ